MVSLLRFVVVFAIGVVGSRLLFVVCGRCMSMFLLLIVSCSWLMVGAVLVPLLVVDCCGCVFLRMGDVC